MKWIPLAIVLLGATAGLYIAVAARAESSREAYRREVEADLAVAREQAEATRRPVLWGRPADCEAMGRYQRVLVAAARWSLPSALYERVTAAAGTQPGPLPEAAGLLREHRLALQELADATACTRAGWQRGMQDDPIPQGRLRLLGALLVLDGEAKAGSDPAGAAGRYLAAVRLGSDMADASFATQGLAGGELMAAGLAALGRLGPAAAREPRLRASLAQSLTAVAGILPGSAVALRRDRLQILQAVLQNGQDQTYVPVVLSGVPRQTTSGFFAFAPASFFWSRALHAVDSTFRAAEAAADTAPRRTLAGSLRDAAAAPWNPLLLEIAPNYLAALRQADVVAERYDLARSTLSR